MKQRSSIAIGAEQSVFTLHDVYRACATGAADMTTGITTCAEHHIARAIPNLDDGNQIMWQLPQENIVASPDLNPVKGKLSLGASPRGFELDTAVVDRAAKRFCDEQAE